MGKVKKAGAVRRARARKSAKGKDAPSGARKSTSRKVGPGKRGHGVAAKRPIPVPKFRVTALDPRKKCGAGTSVQQLFRISEDSADGATRSHLVFLDRHGWYCEHGRECPAVRHAQKFR